MNSKFRMLAVLFLMVLWLPACAEFQTWGPPAAVPEVRKAEAALFQEAEASYRRQAYRQAHGQYAAYLERFPQGPHAMEARLKEAEVLGFLGDWQGSLRHYQGLLARQPESGISQKARYGMGRAYFKLGQYQQATQVLDSLTASDLPRSLWFSTQALLAEIALKQGKVSQAFARLRLAGQDLPSGDQEWFDDLKTRLVEQATPEELEQLATLYRDSRLSAALLLRLARLAQEAGRTGEARRWVNTLKERFPQTPEVEAGERLLTGGKIFLGCLLPLSGQFSNVGFKVQRGMELAARQAPVELLFRDTHGAAETASRLTRELAQDERVLAILGPLSSGVAQAAGEAAQESGVPLLALSQKEGLTRTGNLVFQAFLTPRQQVRALVRQALSRGLKRYAVLYPDSPYGRTFLQNFQEELAAQGGELVGQEFYASGTRDFSPALSSLKAVLQPQATPGAPGAEALFIPDDAAQVAAIAGQLPAAGLPGIQLLGTNLLHHPEIPEAQLGSLQGVLFPDAFFAGDPDPGVQKFISAYQQQYGQTPDYLAAQGYVVLRIMLHLAETKEAISRATLPQQLLALKGVPDLPWFRGFSGEREETAAMYVLTFQDGRVGLASQRSEVSR